LGDALGDAAGDALMKRWSGITYVGSSDDTREDDVSWALEASGVYLIRLIILACHMERLLHITLMCGALGYPQD
jgi:hypothetical protein